MQMKGKFLYVATKLRKFSFSFFESNEARKLTTRFRSWQSGIQQTVLTLLLQTSTWYLTNCLIISSFFSFKSYEALVNNLCKLKKPVGKSKGEWWMRINNVGSFVMTERFRSELIEFLLWFVSVFCLVGCGTFILLGVCFTQPYFFFSRQISSYIQVPLNILMISFESSFSKNYII